MCTTNPTKLGIRAKNVCDERLKQGRVPQGRWKVRGAQRGSLNVFPKNILSDSTNECRKLAILTA